MRSAITIILLLICVCLSYGAEPDFTHFNPELTGLVYINTSFENASPLYYETDADGVVHIYLVYDQERDSPNRANGHWYYQVQGEPGSDVTIMMHNFENIWNGRRGIPVGERTFCLVSPDGRKWEKVETELVDGVKIKFTVHLEQDSLYVVHVEPYRISDLESMKQEISGHALVEISTIGHTVEGRELEIIRVGNPEAPHRIFLRARAHPWEPGGNWVVQGLIHSLLQESEENQKYLERYAVYILPMANKDGVARGRTRFNSMGWDLNRKWDQLADRELAPENYYLEKWFQSMIDQGKPIQFAIDLHNDQAENSISRPNVDLEKYLATMKKYCFDAQAYLVHRGQYGSNSAIREPSAKGY